MKSSNIKTWSPSLAGVMAILVGVITALPICADTTKPMATPNAGDEIRQLREQLAEQTKRIDRLYFILGPNLQSLEAAAVKSEQQAEEDAALKLETVCVVTNHDLSDQAQFSPVDNSFAVLTREDGLRLFDAAGQQLKNFQPPGHQITCLAFSPTGSELLTGTKSWALLFWDVAKNTWLTFCTNLGTKVERVTWVGRDKVAWGSSITYWKPGGIAVDHCHPVKTC